VKLGNDSKKRKKVRPSKHFIFEIDDIETEMNYLIEEFEKNRRILLQNYNSNIQTHAGYLIAIIIGSLTVISQSETFLNNGLPSRLAFYVLLDLIFILSFYVVGRMLYWTFLSSGVIDMVYSKFTSYREDHEYYYIENGSHIRNVSDRRQHSKLRLIQDLAIEEIKKEKNASWGLKVARRFSKRIGRVLFILFFSILGIFLFIDSLVFNNPLVTFASFLVILLGFVCLVLFF
jgi:hypothetical protein